MNELSRKTVLTFVSVIVTVVVMIAMLVLFFSQLWKSPDNPLGSDISGAPPRMLDKNQGPDFPSGG